MKEIHSFKEFSVGRSSGGDYIAEHNDGRTIMIMSPDGSSEHAKGAAWIENPNRTADDFLSMEPKIQDGVTDDA